MSYEHDVTMARWHDGTTVPRAFTPLHTCRQDASQCTPIIQTQHATNGEVEDGDEAEEEADP